jgi:hypothetical protein
MSTLLHHFPNSAYARKIPPRGMLACVQTGFVK